MDDLIKEVYILLRDREINPTGSFDSSGRWYAYNSDLISVRSPSRAYPLSQLKACRTKKYVKAVAKHFNCQTKQELLNKV